jgi:hypothetical protein
MASLNPLQDGLIFNDNFCLGKENLKWVGEALDATDCSERGCSRAEKLGYVWHAPHLHGGMRCFEGAPQKVEASVGVCTLDLGCKSKYALSVGEGDDRWRMANGCEEKSSGRWIPQPTLALSPPAEP